MVANEWGSETGLQIIEHEEDTSSLLSSAKCTKTNSQLAKDCSVTSSQNQGPLDQTIHIYALSYFFMFSKPKAYHFWMSMLKSITTQKEKFTFADKY